MKNTTQPKDGKLEPDRSTFVPFTWNLKTKKLIKPMKINGVTQRFLLYYSVHELVDTETGEIFLASDVNRKYVEYHYLLLQRQAILESLRPEIKDLALFVLKFRDRRRGITPNVNKILRWYSEIHQKHYSNVLRHKKKLVGKILERSDDTLLTAYFQNPGRNTSAKDHKQVYLKSEIIYEREKTKAKLLRG
jgi:hypothetical protein